MSPATTLILIKLAHTVVWAALAGIILALPWFIHRRRWTPALILIAIVIVECGVLALNHMRCPLTDLAARYSGCPTSRSVRDVGSSDACLATQPANFDIYLPLWLAANNKLIFGTLFTLDLLFAVFALFAPSRPSRGTRSVETTS